MGTMLNYHGTEFEKGWDAGYEACREEYEKKAIRETERKQKQKEESRRKLYFVKQKLLGVLLILLTVFIVVVIKCDPSVGLFTVPIGAVMIFTKSMVWMDSYYYEVQEREKNRAHF